MLFRSIMKAWEFPDVFAEVAQHWADVNYRSTEVSYIDFIRIGAILEGTLQVSDKSAALQTYIDKGIIPSLEMLESEEYLHLVEDVKEMFS